MQELQHRPSEYSDEFHIVEFQMLLSKLMYVFIYVKSMAKTPQPKWHDKGLKKTKQKNHLYTPPSTQENTLSEGLLSQQFEDWHELPLRNHPQNYW